MALGRGDLPKTSCGSSATVGSWWSWQEGTEGATGGGGWGRAPHVFPGPGQVCWPQGTASGLGWLLGILLRPLHLASQGPAGGAFLPEPSLGHALSLQD